jgi:hypothetical protein
MKKCLLCILFLIKKNIGASFFESTDDLFNKILNQESLKTLSYNWSEDLFFLKTQKNKITDLFFKKILKLTSSDWELLCENMALNSQNFPFVLLFFGQSILHGFFVLQNPEKQWFLKNLFEFERKYSLSLGRESNFCIQNLNDLLVRCAKGFFEQKITINEEILLTLSTAISYGSNINIHLIFDKNSYSIFRGVEDVVVVSCNYNTITVSKSTKITKESFKQQIKVAQKKW